jgi:hypothetical protein
MSYEVTITVNPPGVFGLPDDDVVVVAGGSEVNTPVNATGTDILVSL